MSGINAAHVAAGLGQSMIGEYLEPVGADGPHVIGQVETAATDDPVEVLADGLDVLLCGTTDLSVALGEPGALDGAAVRSRASGVVDAAARAGSVRGGFAATTAGVGSLIGTCARCVALGADLGFLGSARCAVRSDATSVLEAA